MTAHRIYGKIVFECEDCDETLETEQEDIAQASAVRRRAGWSAHQEAGEWVHFCKRHAE